MSKSIKGTFLAMTALVIFGVGSIAFSPNMVDANSEVKDEPLLVHIATNDSATAGMALLLASNMFNQGKDVAVFLDVKGVVAAVKNPPQEFTPLSSKVQGFLDEGGRVLVCGHCLGASGFGAEDLLPGTEIGNPGKMSRLFSGHMSIISY